MDKSYKILHVVPDSINRPTNFYLGSTKDIKGRTEYLQSKGIKYDELLVPKRLDSLLLELIQNIDLTAYDTIFFELALYPKTMAYLREKYPHIKQIIRSINADFFHWLHYFYATLLYPNLIFSSKESLKQALKLEWFRYAFERLNMDITCAGYADFVLSIVEWEKEHYWRYVTDEKKVRNLPYFLPAIYTRETVETLKKKQCVGLMSSTAGTAPLMRNNLVNYANLVGRLGRQIPSWRFFITGDMTWTKVRLPTRLEATGFLESPFPLLLESRAMALMSDLGFGFKTKLLDAIQSRCYPLVPPNLFRRLPEEIKPYCLVVKKNSVPSFLKALEASEAPYPPGNPNAVFREKAFTVLDEVFGD